MESEYMPLVVISCAPFVYYVLPKMKPKLSVALFAAIYFIRIVCIFNASVPFTNRVGMIEKMSAKMKQKNLAKVIIPAPLPVGMEDALISTWGTPVESFFVSKLNGEQPQRTFIILDADRLKTFNTASKDTLLGSWEKRSAADINGCYFKMDTSTTYKVVTYAELME